MLASGYLGSYSGEHKVGVTAAGTMSFRVLRSDPAHDQSLLAAHFTAQFERDRLEHAVNMLRRASPRLSAAEPLVAWQRIGLVFAAGAVPLLTVLMANGASGSWAIALPLFFAVIVFFRIAAVVFMFMQRERSAPLRVHLSDSELPPYSVIVPLYRESAVAPALLEAMRALNYPTAKLEILFVTEAADTSTRAALLDANPSHHMRILIVPAGQPQTKPRALNYALQSASGSLVAVFDAEDVPDPLQLRLAAAHFAASGPDLVCVQARLSIYNPDASILARQFTLEYAALFEAILPLLQRLGLPILLGGTSNHFRRSALDEVGGWDPFNVTEDADLGVRLARFGHAVAMLDSDTAEEAPALWRDWLGQRTRWLKGWMQTYAVHMRDPQQLWHDLGAWRFLGFQVTLGGMILSALVHPWFYAVTAYKLLAGQTIFPADNTLWSLCCFNLAAGYLAGISLGLIAAWRSQGRVSALSAFLVPFYWLAISVASYRALHDLYMRPYHWEKTPHGPRPVTTAPVPNVPVTTVPAAS